MMKKTVIIVFLLALFLSRPCFSQLFPVHPEIEIGEAKLIVTYMKTSRQDSLSASKRREKMTLYLDDNLSYFFSEAYLFAIKAMQRFSSFSEFQSFINAPSTGYRNPDYRYMIFKNYPEGKITTTDHFPSDNFLYTEELALFDWKITDETLRFFGYTAQKATTSFAGRDWVAWFVPEIPFNDGPYKFNGLPGLIFKIQDTRNHYSFELISLEIPKEPTPIHFTDRPYIRTTKDGFFRAWNAFRYGFISRAEQHQLDAHTQNVMGENLRRHNNPIELRAE